MNNLSALGHHLQQAPDLLAKLKELSKECQELLKMASEGAEVRGSLDRQGGGGLLRLSMSRKEDSMRLSLSNKRLQSVNTSMIAGT